MVKRNPSAFASSNRLAESRGLPCILFTCERGLEKSATIEFKEFLSFHLGALLKKEGLNDGLNDGLNVHEATTTSNTTTTTSNTTSTSTSNTNKLSLDDELAQLRASKGATSEVNKKKVRAYGTDIFQTGISGISLAVFRNAERTARQTVRTVTATNTASTTDTTTDTTTATDSSSNPPTKKLKTDDGPIPSATTTTTPPSQQRTIVNSVIYSIFSSLTTPSPSSPLEPRPKFVLRAVPLMVTCFLNIDEIKKSAEDVVKELVKLSEALPLKTPKTFAIQEKRRHSNKTPDRNTIISSLASIVPPSLSVDLTSPTFTIVIEIFRNMVGIGLVKDYKGLKKLNLLEANIESHHDHE
ncbi:hypothetical protein TrST_g6427 [Triparma strigata]|uniref:THUMP domain-containing protein n=1 Tax=Triparma strigata TaxID=1606541 RepID=A0A9W7EZP9_9STRA|nr:hypothetical protein TrST_g6427 [Triparma strigata]